MWQSEEQDVIGWDIGGAHLKAVRVAGGEIRAAVQVACPLWRGMDRLETAFVEVEAALGLAAVNAVTMTGELTDFFADRPDGVAAISARAAERLAGVSVYSGARGFVPPQEAAALAADVASANWHATASLAARLCGEGLLVDMGSTTTDIIPFRGGKVCGRGSTDAGRLSAGELVYTGMSRTMLMSLAATAPVAGVWTGVMAEYFASMGDVNRILGRSAPDDDQHDTADGQPKGGDHDRRRLLRMVGRDLGDLTESDIVALAGWFAEVQLRRVHDGALQVLSGAGLDPAAPVVGCGAGLTVISDLAMRLGRTRIDLGDRLPVSAEGGDALRRQSVIAAPAAAVALLRCIS